MNRAWISHGEDGRALAEAVGSLLRQRNVVTSFGPGLSMETEPTLVIVLMTPDWVGTNWPAFQRDLARHPIAQGFLTD